MPLQPTQTTNEVQMAEQTQNTGGGIVIGATEEDEEVKTEAWVVPPELTEPPPQQNTINPNVLADAGCEFPTP